MNPFRTPVNSFISLVFVGSFALFASLLIWNAAGDENPLAEALVPLVIDVDVL